MAGDDPRAELFGAGASVISRYVDILASRGIDWGFVGPREGDRLWERHVLNSIAADSLLPVGASVVDVGSGAGLPGIPLAILRPDLRVTLLESLLRRVNFLELAVVELGLGERVRIVRGRAEEHRETYDVVTCRAVAPLPRLVSWCLPLLGPSGRLVALKGTSAAAELTEARPLLQRHRLVAELHELAVPGTPDSTWVIEVARRR